MATNQYPSSSLSRWLFWSESLLLVITTALATFIVLYDTTLSFGTYTYGIGMVVPPCLVGFVTVFFLALRNRQIKKSFQTGVLIIVTGEVTAVFVNLFLVNAIWQELRPSCPTQCGNGGIIATLEVLCPIMSMLPGIAAAGFASLLGWTASLSAQRSGKPGQG